MLKKFGNVTLTPMIDKGLGPMGTMEERSAMESNVGRGATGSSAGRGATGRSGSTSINDVCGCLTRSLDVFKPFENTALMNCVFPFE